MNSRSLAHLTDAQLLVEVEDARRRRARMQRSG